MSKDFYNVAVDIYKVLRLDPEHRNENAKDYLNKKYAEYVKLKESSPLNGKLKHDLLAKLPQMEDEGTESSSPVYKSILNSSYIFDHFKSSEKV